MSNLHDMPLCDLRYLNSVEAVRQIEKIEDIALLILPKDAPDDVMSAIAAIDKNDIASIIYLGKDEEVSIINGTTELTDAEFPPDKVKTVMVNGMAFIRELSPEAKGNVYVNGSVVINSKLKQCNLNFVNVNGSRQYADFEHMMFFGNKFELDAITLQEMKPKTCIGAGNKIKINYDVTLEMLREKEITFFVGDTLKCRRNVSGYVKVNSFVGNQIEIYD